MFSSWADYAVIALLGILIGGCDANPSIAGDASFDSGPRFDLNEREDLQEFEAGAVDQGIDSLSEDAAVGKDAVSDSKRDVAPISDAPVDSAPVPDLILPDAVKVDSGASPTPLCSADWCWMLPKPHGNFLEDIWSDGSKAWAVGRGGTVMHRQVGGDWSVVSLGTSRDLFTVWGSSAKDVWIGGTEGQLYHWDGTAFAPVSLGVPDYTVRALWGHSANDIWAVVEKQYSSLIYRYDGTSWTLVDPGTTLPSMYDVWGASAQDVFIVGDSSAVLHYDGTKFSWISVYANTQPILRRVWGTGPSDVWAAAEYGNFGQVYRYKGGLEFAEVQTNLLTNIWDISGSGPNDIWLVGNDVIAHYDGTTFNEKQKGVILTSVTAEGNDFVAVGKQGTIVKSKGAGTWLREDLQTFALETYDWFVSLWASGPSDLFASTRFGRLLHFDGNAWTEQTLNKLVGYTSPLLWGDGTSLWALATDTSTLTSGTARRWDGSAWGADIALPIATVSGVWGASASDIWAVGSEGMAHYDGTTWQSVSHGLGTFTDFDAISGCSANDIYVVGYGLVAHYDGTSWKTLSAGVGTDWLSAVTCVAPNDVWVGGSDSIFYHFDGTTWTPMPSGGWQWINSLRGIAANDVYATLSYAGGYGEVRHFDGQNWSVLPTGSGGWMGSIFSTSAKDIWLISEGGILEKK